MRLFCAEAILNVKTEIRMKAKSHDGVTLCQAPQMRHNARQEVWMQAQSGYNRARKKNMAKWRTTAKQWQFYRYEAAIRLQR